MREALKLGVLNAIKNEIRLCPTNPALKLNLYQAKKQNLVMKPLTLSEAFLKNLIQPNGFVRNPVNCKFYAFESLILSELDLHVFDMDTKHILDPDDAEKRRLLSLRDAISSGLIRPRTFELVISASGKTQNLYSACLSGDGGSSRLIVHRPHIENVYIKLMTNRKSNETEQHTANSRLAVIRSKRERIGLGEAINLGVVNMRNKTYKFVFTNNELSSEKISLDEATFRFNLIDRELILLLNQTATEELATEVRMTLAYLF